MGDARRLKKKYMGPAHPWQKTRIEEEKKLIKDYGLKNKKEIWKLNSKLKTFGNIAKKLIAATGAQAEKEQNQLFARLKRLGLVGEEAKLDDILGLTIQDIMERRLQTIIFRKGLARTMKQARQFITHNHIIVKNNTLGVPGYIVPIEEEAHISFKSNTTLANENHPERTMIRKVDVTEDEDSTEAKDETKKDSKDKKEKKESKSKNKKPAAKKEPKTESKEKKSENKTEEKSE